MNKFCKSIFFVSLIFSSKLFALDIPNGYKEIQLGMSVNEVQTELLKDTDFGYNGESDVSLLPNSNRTLIETDATKTYGLSFLTTCYFQFFEEKLYIITINVNQDKMDYYSIFTTLCKKYGNPQSFTSESATWKSDYTTMTLEKPLTLKYINNQAFENAKTYSDVPKAGNEITREQFLEEL